VPDRTALAAVSADVLVLAQEGDPLHPADVGRQLAAVLPRARLVVFEHPGVVFRERARLRELISSHLAG
jgi:pimeloyl-ACP methyl ester carboxylesterase